MEIKIITCDVSVPNLVITGGSHKSSNIADNVNDDKINDSNVEAVDTQEMHADENLTTAMTSPFFVRVRKLTAGEGL